MSPSRRYPREIRERAVALVRQARARHGIRRGAIAEVAEELGINPVTLGGWVRQSDLMHSPPRARSARGGDDRRRIEEMEQEIADLKRANELLRMMSAVFAESSRNQRPDPSRDPLDPSRVRRVEGPRRARDGISG